MKFYFLCLILSLNIFLTIIMASNMEKQPQKCDDKNEDSSPCTSFYGSNIFGKNSYPNKCFTAQQVSLLQTLRIFQFLIPRDYPQTLLNDEIANSLINYFSKANKIILREIKDDEAQKYAELAFYDTVGGYLNHYLIPLTRFSYYGGSLSLEVAQKLVQFHNHCKEYLNTNGNGWLQPKETSQMFKIDTINKECIKRERCSELLPNDDSSDHMLVPLPKIEHAENDYLSQIKLPFKHKRLYNLQSDNSAYIILKYFAIASKCYLDEEISADEFHDKLKAWYRENLEVHLNDPILYPGLGAMLKVVETINCINRRNLDNKIINKDTDYNKYIDFSEKSKYTLDNKQDNLMKRREQNWIESIVDKKRTSIQCNRYLKMAIKAAIIGAITILGTALVWWLVRRRFKNLFNNKKSECRIKAGGVSYPYHKLKQTPKFEYQNSPDDDDDDDDVDYYYDEEDTLFNKKCTSKNSDRKRVVYDEVHQKKIEGNKIAPYSVPYNKKNPKKTLTCRQFSKLTKTDSIELYNLTPAAQGINHYRVYEIKKPTRMETSSSESSNSLKKYSTRIPRKIDNIKLNNGPPRQGYLSEPGPPISNKSCKLEMISEKPDIKKSPEIIKFPVIRKTTDIKKTPDINKTLGTKKCPDVKKSPDKKFSIIRGKPLKAKVLKVDNMFKAKKTYEPIDKKSIGRTTSWETDLENE